MLGFGACVHTQIQILNIAPGFNTVVVSRHLSKMKSFIKECNTFRTSACASEVENGHADITKYLPDMCTLNLKGQNGKRDQPFTFDGVFSPAIQQQDIFQDVEHLIQSAIDGR